MTTATAMRRLTLGEVELDFSIAVALVGSCAS